MKEKFKFRKSISASNGYKLLNRTDTPNQPNKIKIKRLLQ